ncbi:MAG: phage/plasmid primase, P4 family [Methanoregula sp.]|nr:phage/plasmid primase, P4 family [Methanoregula sp.]
MGEVIASWIPHPDKIDVDLVNFGNIPDQIKMIPNWIIWRNETKDGLVTKIPYNPITGDKADTTNSGTWSTFEVAVQSFKVNGFNGIGFVLTKDSDIIGVDFDHVINDDGEIDPDIEGYIQQFNSYAEISPSGKGIHILCIGKKPGNRSRKANIEMYDSGRYLTVTGNVLSQYTWIRASQAAIDSLYSKIDDSPRPDPASTFPNIEKDELSDDTIISIINSSKKREYREHFRDLINGDFSKYPSQSEADQALCNYLAFYTKNAVQIDRIFRKSKLYRAKWDAKRGQLTYGELTIKNALQSVVGQYIQHKEVAEQWKGYHLTENGAAYRFADLFGDSLLFCKTMNKWFVWDGRRYKIDTTNKVQDLTKKMVLDMWSELPSIHDKYIREKFFNHLKQLDTITKITNITKLASSEPQIAIEQRDIDNLQEKIVLNNGVFDLAAMQLEPFNRDYRISKKMNVDYIPGATCPKWEEHIKFIFGDDDELAEAFQIAVGYTFIEKNPQQVLFLAHGAGENGKSTTFNVLTSLFADYATQTSFDTFAVKPVTDPRSDLALLKGARFVIAAEASDDKKSKSQMKILDTELLKRITGGELIKCRFLYGEWDNIDPQFDLWLMLNELPNITDTTHAMWRRIVLFPFTRTIPRDRKIDLYHKILIKEESAGIFSWVIEGYRKYKQLGHLKISDKMTMALEDYHQQQDDVLRFIKERKLIGQKMNKTDIWTEYGRWCASEEIPSKGKKLFYKELLKFDWVRQSTVHGTDMIEFLKETQASIQ